MVLHSPPPTKKVGANNRGTTSASDLPPPSPTISTSALNFNLKHSAKQQQNAGQHDVNVLKIALPAENEVISLSNLSAKNINNKSALLDTNSNSEVGQCLVQTGLDRYITVQPKRKRSPRSAAKTSMSKFTKLASLELTHGNRFSSLINIHDDVEVQSSENKLKTEKPPPIYLREAPNANLVKAINHLTEGNFYISGVKKGNIKETKIQTLNIDAYRALTNNFEQAGKHYYTYQLKSQKGLVVVIKGIESYVSPDDIHTALAEKGFQAKSITNIFNREKEPQPLFRIVLEPDDKKTKGKHQIFDLRYLLHRRIIVEEPRKRSGPIQCIKCQEFGHTKAYCTLNDVCVICGDLHNSKQCNKSKTDSSVRKCSNCDGNHTANYRGCPVYRALKLRTDPKQRAEQRNLKLQSSSKATEGPESVFNNTQERSHTINHNKNHGVSYADILKGPYPKESVHEDANVSNALNKLTNMMQSFMTMMERTMDLMMQNMNVLMQIVVKNQK